METADKLKAIVGNSWVIMDKEHMIDYLTDETYPPLKPKAASKLILVKPASAQEVSKILKLANRGRIPVFARGGGTGLCGGAIPTRNGIILSLERLKGLEIDKDNLMAIAEAGVTLKELIEKVEGAGLFFPPHPGDESAQVGGLVACNAGGVRAVKYGVMRSYVKGIDAVLPTGEILNLGGELLKDNTGYDLMHLIIGSEGTLVVITRVILRLYPQAAASATMIVPYDNRHDAINTVPKILQSGIIPLAAEYVPRLAVEVSAASLGVEWPCKTGTDYLILIVEGRSDEEVHMELERISEICQSCHGLEPVIGETKKEQEKILKIRSNMYFAARDQVADGLDVAVPPASMGKLMDAIDEVAQKFGTVIPMAGHVGDGNLHPVLMKSLADSGMQNLKKAKREIYREALKLGGTMTAEHGVGKIRTSELGIFLNNKELQLMRGIKEVFDPNGILNPECAMKCDR